ncbi:hypothetical protein NLX86_12145 [Streptomyces sp. A3M-1-3]|uniref:DUF6256 family protein n=1 Tax=Streptomyces sp. A3M-1-3 TaxID=2962044 RepID=UPI0020B8F56C|nr:DUF6256 family protein [Streptomyces sp. A3M-1-3]MCP3818833.1 hypothetical protein [Streptomyces sp. A3M-1-3]
MLTGYLLVMGYLALGLLILHRLRAQSDRVPRPRADRHASPLAPARARRGWPALILRVTGTAVGGYLLLMTVVVGYYRGVAGLDSQFVASALTGCALLVGITLPAFFAASWLVERMRRRRTD